jgi:hypothetical protein
MKRMSICLCGLVLVGAIPYRAVAITDPDFDLGGSGWTVYTSGSGSVSFSGGVATLTAFVFADAGIEQEETRFTTFGQEFQLDINVLTNGNVLTGWGDAFAGAGVTTIYPSGATGVRSLRTDDPAYNWVFAEKTGSIGGIIDIDYMHVTEITAPPTYAGAAGVVSAVRTSPTSADLTWNAATDNVTPDAQIHYDVYWSTSSGNVIAGGVKTTFDGVSSGAVTGLPANQQVYFTVRARDRVNNREANTVQVGIEGFLAAAGWELYE